MENLNSLLKFRVWESGRKIDLATGVSRISNLERKRGQLQYQDYGFSQS